LNGRNAAALITLVPVSRSSNEGNGTDQGMEDISRCRNHQLQRTLPAQQNYLLDGGNNVVK